MSLFMLVLSALIRRFNYVFLAFLFISTSNFAISAESNFPSYNITPSEKTETLAQKIKKTNSNLAGNTDPVFIIIQEKFKQSNWKPVIGNWYWRSSIKLGLSAKISSIDVLFNGKENIYSSSPWLLNHPYYITEINYTTNSSIGYQASALLEFAQVWSKYISPFFSIGPYFKYSSVSANHTYEFIANNISGAGQVFFMENNGLGSFSEVHDLTVTLYDIGLSINLGFVFFPQNLYPLTSIKTSLDSKTGTCFLKRNLVFTETYKDVNLIFTPKDFYSSADLCISSGYSISAEFYGNLELEFGYEFNFDSTHENPSGYLFLNQHSIIINLKYNL